MAPDAAELDAITFGTDGWRARGDAFSVPRIRAVGQATASYLDDQEIDGPVAIGYDARDTSEDAAKELARVAAANGRDVTVTERDCPTPALAWTTKTGRYAAGLMVTASHNPPEYNGIKLVDSAGAPALPAVTDQVAAHIGKPEPAPPSEHGTVRREALHDSYLDHAVSFVDADLDGLAVAVDAMHGSARGVTDELLSRLGGDLTRIRDDRDPAFGGDSPEPGPDRVGQLLDAVVDGDASLGFVNDGDGDRLGVVTPERGYLDPNLVLAVLYQFVLDVEGGDVVRTVSTSSLVDRIAAEAGYETHETPVGFKWIAAAMAEEDAVAGGEESGGFGVRAHLPNKDGILTAGLLAAAHITRPLDDRIDAIRSTHGTRVQDRRSVTCPEERKGAVLDAVEDRLGDSVGGATIDSVNPADGQKFLLADGSWLLIRPSGTEPKMRVYAESNSEKRTEELLDAGEAAVREAVE